MVVLKVVAVGDSVMWGQGLHDRWKFHESAARRIAALRGADDVEILHLAHSGAYLFHGAPMHPGQNTSTPYWQEVPVAWPTVREQIATAREAHENDSASVDLVLMNGGINDCRGDEILNPTSVPSDQIPSRVKKRCYKQLRKALSEARAAFPHALIVVTGYFQVVSKYTSAKATAVATGLAFASGSLASVVGIVAVAAAGNSIVKRATLFNLNLLRWQRRAVTEAHARDVRQGHPGVLFAYPAFGPKHALEGPDTMLFGPTDASMLDPWMAGRAGALAVGDDVAAERHLVCRKIYPLGPTNDPTNLLICGATPMFHPTRTGAARFTDVIVKRFRANRQVSVFKAGEKLQGEAGPVSLRAALLRHGASSGSISVRACFQHLRVDCIEVRIKTGARGPKGHVWFSIGPKKWALPRLLPGSFSPNSRETFTIDPCNGVPSRAPHLGDIERFELILQRWTSAGDVWDVQEVTVRLNGRVFHESESNAVLFVPSSSTDDSFLLATF